MPQPPAYNRTKDFTVDFGSETDHSALNTELDAASNSINDIRTNIALMQADDGKILQDAITPDSLSPTVKDYLINQVSNGIVTYRDDAQTAAGNAATSATQASTSATNASNSATSAATSATNAGTSATLAQNWATKTDAEVVAGQGYSAKKYAQDAATSATSAGNSASTASTQAGIATTKAGDAATSATNAATSATTATAKAGEAATSATTASTKAGEAATSATNAATSATNAATSETNAANSATDASNSAAAAATFDPALYVPKDGSGTMTGPLNMGAGAKIIFEGTTDDAFETTFDPGNPSADRSIALPDKSGTIALISDVTAGDVNTIANGKTGGTTGPTSRAALGVAWELISTATASNSAIIDFTGLSGGSYSEFFLVLEEISSSANGVSLLMQLSTGAGFLGSGYNYGVYRWTHAGTGVDGGISSGNFALSSLTETHGAGTNQRASYNVRIIGADSTLPTKRCTWDVSGLWSSGTYVYMMGGGEVDTNSAPVNGIRLLMSSGSIALGKVYLYGLKNTTV